MNKITEEDVKKVAKKLHFLPTKDEIQQVIDNYDLETENDPSGCLPIWIESLLYNFGVKQIIPIVKK